MLKRMVNNLNAHLSANLMNLTIARMNDFVASGVIHNGNAFFSITIRENLVKLSEVSLYADVLAYKEVLSLTHQGQMEDVAEKIKKFFYDYAMKSQPQVF